MAVNGRNQANKNIKHLGNWARGIKATEDASDKTYSQQQELDMMSDSLRSEKEDRPPANNGDLRAIVTDTINMLEPMYERLIKEVAREAAREAVASMNKQIKTLKEQVAAKDQEIVTLEREKKDLQNESQQNKDKIAEKEKRIRSLQKEVKELKKQLKEQEAALKEEQIKAAQEKEKADKLAEKLSAEKADHQKTKSQANVNMRKMQEKMLNLLQNA